MILQFFFSRKLPTKIELKITRGTDTSNRTRVNFIPKNEASNSVIGIRHTAAALITSIDVHSDNDKQVQRETIEWEKAKVKSLLS